MQNNLLLNLWPETVKFIAAASINNAYAPISIDGTAATVSASGNPLRQVLIQNGTDGDIMISMDGVTDHMPVFRGAFLLFDVTSNSALPAGALNVSKGVSLYAIRLTATAGGAGYTNPTTGSVFVSFLYAK